MVVVATARLSQGPLELMRRAAGSPTAMVAKARRLGATLRAFTDGASLDARLERLRRLGYLREPPTRLQIAVGAADMLRFWISPAAAEYYAEKGIGFGFHQLLRVLDDPASMVDPTGFFSDPDTIIGHLLQVVHANPAYDLQLLDAHEGGIDELERQVLAILDGTHPRAASIGAVVEEADYHQRLLGYVRAYQGDGGARPPLRDNVAGDPKWRDVEATFGTLVGSVAYFSTMPRTASGAIWHLLTVRSFAPRAP